jgi:hypothetical protein
MSVISGFYETENIQSLISDYLPYSKFDGSLIVLRNAKDLCNKKGIITDPTSALYYIKPNQQKTVYDAVAFVTTIFNEHTLFDNSKGGMTNLLQIANVIKDIPEVVILEEVEA